MTYLTFKSLHILSMVLLFGVGLGSAFYKWMADRSHDQGHIHSTNRTVVFADWLFTTPTVLLQPVTGAALVVLSGIPLSTGWLLASIVLYLVAGACWVPVVVLQIRMRELSRHAVERGTDLPALYWHYARIWFWLGVPAFLSMIMIVCLMVYKPVWSFL